MEEKPDFKKIILGLIVGTVILTGITYAGYLYSQKSSAKIVSPTIDTSLTNPPTAPQRFTAGPDVPWVEFKGKIYPYSFKYPQTLTLNVFLGDTNDSVAVVWGNIPAQNNILLNIENIPDRDPAYVGKIEEYARNWYRFFSGLTSVSSLEKFTNANGLVGYKTIYVNNAGQSPNTDIFFEIPNDPNKAVHIANGVLDPVIFDRIVDSLNYKAE